VLLELRAAGFESREGVPRVLAERRGGGEPVRRGSRARALARANARPDARGGDLVLPRIQEEAQTQERRRRRRRRGDHGGPRVYVPPSRIPPLAVRGLWRGRPRRDTETRRSMRRAARFSTRPRRRASARARPRAASRAGSAFALPFERAPPRDCVTWFYIFSCPFATDRRHPPDAVRPPAMTRTGRANIADADHASLGGLYSLDLSPDSGGASPPSPPRARTPSEVFVRTRTARAFPRRKPPPKHRASPFY